MKIIDGKKIAEGILVDLKKEISQHKIKTSLAIILVGQDLASHLYVQQKEKAAQEIGLEIKKHLLPGNTSEEKILELIGSLNKNTQVNGILVQMPLPKEISADRVVQAIAPQKDVDGFLSGSKFDPPFILAIEQALEATGENLQDKKAVALVNSDVFGERLVGFFRNRGLSIDYLKQEQAIKEADLVITALGQPNLIKGHMIKKGVILIDGGISRKNGKIIGDVDKESVKEKASWLSPVPGGLGPLTVAYLLKNLVLAFQ